jgi:hypothetical protein
MNQRKAIRIGVIADTHGLFDPAIRQHFRGVDYILHAGDIGKRSVIEQLEQIAPVTAVRPALFMKVRRESVQTRSETGTRRREVLRHTRAVCRRAERRDCPSQPRIHACSRNSMNNAGQGNVDDDQCGFPSEAVIELAGRCPNPGSAGPKRFTLPRGLGILQLESGKFPALHIDLTAQP